MQSTAIGIDPSWTLTNPTGICIMQSDDGIWQVMEAFADVITTKAIRTQITMWQTDNTTVAVDAPLWIPNRIGIRNCDRQIISGYHKFKIGVYPCNKTIAKTSRWKTTSIRKILSQEGYNEAARHGLAYFETYPHPELVNLLGLKERPLYKKGTLASRHSALSDLGELLFDRVTTGNPKVRPDKNLLQLLQPEFNTLNLKTLKCAEDQLDAFICAYSAAYWSYLSASQSIVVGEFRAGLMIFPGPINQP